MINIVLLGYFALIGLAGVLRWRYRIWLLLLLGTLGAVAFEWQHFKFARAQFPLYTKEVAARLRARPWPSDPADVARLIASFKAIGDVRDSSVLRQLYQLEVARGLAGEQPERFGTVAEALVWNPPDIAPGAPTTTWHESVKSDRRALNGMLEVQSPRVSGWPTEMARDAPVGDNAREVAPGVWIAPKPTNPLVGTLRFPLSVHHHGKARIADAHLTVVVSDQRRPAGAEAKSPSFSCQAPLHDVKPGDTRWISCDVIVGIGSDKVIHRLLDQIERLRAGQLFAQVRVGGELDASVRQVPEAETFIAEEIDHLRELKEEDKQMVARREALVPRLQLALILGAIFGAGVVIPGLKGRSLSVGVTLALAFAGAAVALAVGIVDATRTPNVRGWELIIGVFAATEYGAPFLGGLLFGNLVYLRQKNA